MPLGAIGKCIGGSEALGVSGGVDKAVSQSLTDHIGKEHNIVQQISYSSTWLLWTLLVWLNLR